MGKIMIDIEKSSNGGYIVIWHKSIATAIQKLGGAKSDSEHLTFKTIQEIAEWMEKVI